MMLICENAVSFCRKAFFSLVRRRGSSGDYRYSALKISGEAYIQYS